MALQLQKQMFYIGERDFKQGSDLHATIEAVWMSENARGKADVLVAMKLDDSGEERKMSMWGSNLNRLIAAYGDDGHAWVGKRIAVHADLKDGKWIKTVTAAAPSGLQG